MSPPFFLPVSTCVSTLYYSPVESKETLHAHTFICLPLLHHHPLTWFVSSIFLFNFFFHLLTMIMFAAVMIMALVLCSGSRADGPGHDHVATNPQKVLLLFLLTEWII